MERRTRAKNRAGVSAARGAHLKDAAAARLAGIISPLTYKSPTLTGLFFSEGSFRILGSLLAIQTATAALLAATRELPWR